MIILEGPDNSGKSTLAKALSQKFNIPISHSGGPTDDIKELIQRTEAILLNSDSPCIRDRIPIISDSIYGRALHRPTPFMGEVLDKYLARLFKCHPVIILCWPSENTLLKGEHQPGMFDTVEHHAAVEGARKDIAQKYLELFGIIPHYVYNWEEKSPDHRELIFDIVKTQRNNMRRRNPNERTN